MIYIIACISMVIDHIGRVFFAGNVAFIALGRLAFPMFAWSIVRGYNVSSNTKLYALRLLLIALISQVPYMLLFHSNMFNVCFTLLAGLISLMMYESRCNKYVKLTAIIGILVLAELCRFEYGIYAILIIFSFYLFGDKDIMILLQLLLSLLYVVVHRTDPVQLVSALSPILIMIVKNRDFKIKRTIRYAIYPGHLLLLYFTMLLMGVGLQ